MAELAHKRHTNLALLRELIADHRDLLNDFGKIETEFPAADCVRLPFHPAARPSSGDPESLKDPQPAIIDWRSRFSAVVAKERTLQSLEQTPIPLLLNPAGDLVCGEVFRKAIEDERGAPLLSEPPPTVSLSAVTSTLLKVALKTQIASLEELHAKGDHRTTAKDSARTSSQLLGDPEIDNYFARNTWKDDLRNTRNTKGHTQEEAGKACGDTKLETYKKWEGGRKPSKRKQRSVYHYIHS